MAETDPLVLSSETKNLQEPLLEESTPTGEQEDVVAQPEQPPPQQQQLSDEREPLIVLQEPAAASAQEEAPQQEEEQQGPDDLDFLNTIDDAVSNDDPVLSIASTMPKPPRLQRISLAILVAVVWSSGILFGLYMIGHYLLALRLARSETERLWNMALPNLYDKSRPMATVGMGLHFLGGSITIILGAIQLMGAVRKRFPVFHRWTGRLYLICSSLTAVGGFMYIWLGHGCIGGKTMNYAFSTCALLTLLCSAQAYRHAALTKRYALHKLWSWRLYSLMISSWMYRLEYATAIALLGLKHDRQHYSYPLDYVMDFFFYLPNLVVVEILWRTRHRTKPVVVSYILSVLMLLTALLVLLTSFMNAVEIWIPGILGHLHPRDDDDDSVDEF